MINIRHSEDRGFADRGWLQSRHTFSFADYFDPEFMSFRDLRVINEDWIAPGKGFPNHPHSDMEIVTYVIEGELEHKDNLGNGSIIRPGEIQRMSAGTGIVHSEYNASNGNSVHLYQIWIETANPGSKPGYEQKSYESLGLLNELVEIASSDPAESCVKIDQDVKLYRGVFEPNAEIKIPADSNRGYWIQMVRGETLINGNTVSTGDGVAVEAESEICLASKIQSELLLFDLR